MTLDENMKKILITIPHSLFPISHGGIVRVIEEVKFLKRQNFDVHLIGNRTKSTDLTKLENELGIHVYSLSWASYFLSGICGHLGLYNLGWFYNPFIKLDLEKYVSRIHPDIIQVEFVYEGLIAAKICKKYQLPFVLSEHNIESILHKSVRDLEVKICNLANFITTVSEHDRNTLEKLNVTTQIKVIPNGVDSKKFQRNSEIRYELRKKYKIEPTDTVIVYHGTLAYLPNRVACEFLKYSLLPDLQKINPQSTAVLRRSSLAPCWADLMSGRNHDEHNRNPKRYGCNQSQASR